MTDNGKPPVVDLPAEQRKIRVQAAFAFAFCAVVLLPATLALPGVLDFPAAVADRLVFVLRIDLLIAAWVFIAVRLVSRVRFISADDNAGSAFSPPSPRLAIRAAFLQNTLEQAFLAVVVTTALLTVEGEAPLAYALGAFVCFSVGRITFLKGYRRGAGGRAFGMVTTVLPTLGGFAWVLTDMVSLMFRMASAA